MAPNTAWSAHMATTTLSVEGMTCGACTSAVEGGFKDVDGIGSVTISLMTERAVVLHDPGLVSAEKVKEIIEDRGFDAEVLSTDLAVSEGAAAEEEPLLASDDGDDGGNLFTTTLAVEGMTCGACTSAVEGGFQRVPGIRSVSISLLSERAVVEHDPEAITPEAIAEIIEDRGFGATVLETKASAPPARARRGRQGAVGSTAVVLTTTTVAVEGMTCGACTSAVEAGFAGVDGLEQFNISLLAERAVILHDAARLPVERIVEIVEDRGFEAKVLSSQQDAVERSAGAVTVSLKLFGLKDSTAVSTLEEALLRLPGVRSCTLNSSASRASVSHVPSAVGLRAIVERIESLGFNALVAESEDNSAQLASLAKTREIQDWRRSFRISASFAVPVFLISMIFPMYIKPLDFGSISLLPGLYLGDVVCLALTIPVQFGMGRRFYISSYKSLSHGSPTMDVLVMMGTSAAFFFSVAAMAVSFLSSPHSRPATVFDTSTMLITFISLGRWLENRAKGQTSKALSSLMSLAPSMAAIYADPIAAEKAAEEWDRDAAEKKGPSMAGAAGNAAEEKVIPTELLQVGDVVILRPGDKVPADGTVSRGQSYVDESMVTGEAVPIAKRRGSLLMAGTVNGAGRLDFRVTRAGRDTQLSQIVKLVQEAQTSRAPIQRLADMVAGYFVPAILTLGLITFISWMVLSHVLPNPPKVFLRPESGGRLMVCMKLCISVIVFACPCALGLSTPTAVMVGTGIGAQHGILVKGGAALETATRITHVVFDKTGTLTFGKMEVAQADVEEIWTTSDWRRRLWWTLVGLAETGSEHPIGKAILASARRELGIGIEGVLEGAIGDFVNTVGQGVTATVEPASSPDRKRYGVLIGNAAFLAANKISLPSRHVPFAHPSSSPSSPSSPAVKVDPSLPTGTTTIYAAIDGVYAGSLSLADTLKPTAPATIAALSRMGISVSLVTGDSLPTARDVASAVNIPPDAVHASISPENKRAIIQALKDQGHTVAMVGDGINDSPALATADIGIALASGTDVAMEAADIVLMRPDDLLNVPAALSLARTIFGRIKLNLCWACLYNVLGLPFAMGFGLMLPGGFMLPPMAAGAAMAASSVSVVTSSLLLKLWRRPRWMSVEALSAEAVAGGDRRRGRFGRKKPTAAGGRDEEELGELRPASIVVGAAEGGRQPRPMLARVRDLLPGRFRSVRGDYVPLQNVPRSKRKGNRVRKSVRFADAEDEGPARDESGAEDAWSILA